METVTYNTIHPLFKLNGFHFSAKELCLLGYNFIKEGEEFEQSVGDFMLNWFDENSYLDLKTSGTTGAPKTIRIQKQSMVNSAIATGRFFELRSGDSALHCLHTKYIAGKMMLVRAFILGLELDFVPPTSNPIINTNQYDFVAMVPLQVQNSLEVLKNVKKLIIGGAKMSKSLEESLSKSPTQVYETYGMTETITHIAVKKLGEKSFSILPDIKISQDIRNCLVIDAPKIAEEQIVTNDLVELLNENEFIFLGRIDNVVNSGGVKLIPEKIEEKLAGKINSRFFVTGIPDAVLGEKLVLVVESENQTLDEAVFDTLEKYEKPKAVFYIPKFATTENGKIKRKEIQSSLDDKSNGFNKN
jgi:o-succinylbenzoate---CoA ligase